MAALVPGGSGCFGETVVRVLRRRDVPVGVFDLVDNDRPRDEKLIRGSIRDASAAMHHRPPAKLGVVKLLGLVP